MKFGADAKPDPIRQKRIAYALAERYPALEGWSVQSTSRVAVLRRVPPLAAPGLPVVGH